MFVNLDSLTPFFRPQGIAVIGASGTAGKLGYGVLLELVRHGFGGGIYPVNPAAQEILGLPCYATVAEVPDPVDLAVIVIPAPSVPAAMHACGERGIAAAIVLSGGFAETGAEGAARQEDIVATARRFDMRLIGPNCVGILDTHSRLNATFIGQMPEPGAIAFLSQSGAIGGAMIDWAKGQNIGLSYFASLGNMADVNESDLIAYLAQINHTNVIALYVEGLKDGRRFLQIARQASQRRPIIALKAGSTQAGARAVSSHTASLAGAEDVYRAALRQAGVLQVDSVADLFGFALGLAYQQPPTGDRVAILTNSGGPGALAADALTRAGLSVPVPGAETTAALRRALGPAPQLTNPIDLLGAASSAEYEAAGRILLHSADYDAVLAILVPNTANDPAGVADALQCARSGCKKPIFACFMGEASVREGRQRLHEHRIPPYAFPESAARALGAAWTWQAWRTSPRPEDEPAETGGDARVYETLKIYQQVGRLFLGEKELYPLLQRLHFPLAPALMAQTPAEAAAHAHSLGGPVALKIASPDLLHKSDAGGVRLGLSDARVVADAYLEMLVSVQTAQPQARITGVLVQKMAAPGFEVIVGMRHDPSFGPMLLFGGGGIHVEALRDVALRVAPITRAEAEDLIQETVSGRLLQGMRGQPAGDLEALIQLVLQVSTLACAAPMLAEFELNPVIVHPAGQGVSIVDARAVLRPT